MPKRPWIVAALTLTCCILLILAARMPIASEALAGLREPVAAPVSAKVIRVANWDSVLGPSGLSAEPPAITLDSQNVRGILGSEARSAADEDMGRVVDVIVDRNGAPRAAVIDFGGFLGVGSRKIAIDWSAVRFTGLNRVTLLLTRDQVKAAPAYETGSKSIVAVGPSPEFVQSRVTDRTPELY
jgi:hypothetical protein